MRHETNPNQVNLFGELSAMPTQAPFRTGSLTSEKAAKKAEFSIIKMHREIILLLANEGHMSPDLTPDDIAKKKGWFIVTVRARCSQLKKHGYIFQSEYGISIQGNKQDAYALTFKGKRLAKELQQSGKG